MSRNSSQDPGLPARLLISSDATVAEELIHLRSCDICHEAPIKGRRFTCLTCDDFDLCERCFNNSGHGHVMRRVARLKDDGALMKLLRASATISADVGDFIAPVLKSCVIELAGAPTDQKRFDELTRGSKVRPDTRNFQHVVCLKVKITLRLFHRLLWSSISTSLGEYLDYSSSLARTGK